MEMPADTTRAPGHAGMEPGGHSAMKMTPDTTQAGGHAGHEMGQAPAMQMRADTTRAGTGGHAMEGRTGSGLTLGEEAIEYAAAGRIRTTGLRAPGTLPGMLRHEADTHGPGNAAVPEMVGSRLTEPGIGLGHDGWRVLVYSDLRALHPRPTFRAPDREIELHLTGNMERFMWSINGKRFGEADPIRLHYGERLRLTMVNDTMMNHPMHLHGMWMELENGHGERIPRVHTVNVQPAERLSLLVDVDAPGRWAFHCHILYHMDVGMFQVVEVPQPIAAEEAR